MLIAVAALVTAALWLGAGGAEPAAAALGQVGCFAGTGSDSCKPVTGEKFGEEVQLGGVGGLAVNYTGAGGVPKGTVYAASSIGGGMWVAMYVPKTGGGLEFSVAWPVRQLVEPYERCGPLLGVDGGGKAEHPCPPRVKAASGWVDVEVEEGSGNVYAVNGEVGVAGRKIVVEYSADGSEEITRFGELASSGKSVAETPSMIHKSELQGGIAVNGAGEVYVFDLNPFDSFYHRLMVFKPESPGDLENYVYTGEVAAGTGPSGSPTRPVADAAGHIYVVSQADSRIEEFAAPTPAPFPAPAIAPICTFDFPAGRITALSVDPIGETPFFFSYKAPKRVYQLGPCNESTHEFEGGIIGETEVSPERDDLYGLAFDPVREFSPTRPAGVLYGAAPGPVPSNGVGSGEPVQSSLGYIFAPAEELPPIAEAEWVQRVRATSTQLRATIDPNGFKTRYSFQYLTEAAFQEAGESFAGAAKAPASEAFLEGTGAAETVGVTLTGLTPDTAYRYRVVASSHCAAGEPEKLCSTPGSAQGFRTFPIAAPILPDNRAYELVSPTQKNGGQVYPADPRISSSCGVGSECKPGASGGRFPMQSSPDGNAVAYEGAGFSLGIGAIENSYIARRTPAGWVNQNPTPNLLQSREGQGYKAISEDLSGAILEQLHPALSPIAPPEYVNLYFQPIAAPLALAPLLTAAPPNRPPTEAGAFKVHFAGASSDLSRVFFEANDALTNEVPGIAPTAEDGGASKSNLYEWEAATGQLRLVNVFPGNLTTQAGASFGVTSAHTVSADGSRVFWSDAVGQVYVREGAVVTKEIPDPGKFLSASVDGSRVLLTNGHLYDLETEASADLTGGKGPTGFKGIAGQSNDLSHVYFVDTEVLTGEEVNSEGAKAVAGKPNLYAWKEEGSTTRYVATLLEDDNDPTGVMATWAALPAARTAEASPHGRYLTFLSKASLTGYDNEGPCGEVSFGGVLLDAPCQEAFVYDSQGEVLRCASCNTSDARPLGWTVLRRILGPGDQPQYLLDSGRLYFDSEDSLSPLDTNEGAEDVYEFKPHGAEGCTRDGGCVSLISGGRSGTDSNLLAVDATGANVFFTTRDRLVAADGDQLIDLYDAREGGGPPIEPAPSEEGLPLQAPPSEPTPASQTVTGPGNFPPGKHCKKGQVKRQGKCVKKKAKRSKRKPRPRGDRSAGK